MNERDEYPDLYENVSKFVTENIEDVYDVDQIMSIGVFIIDNPKKRNEIELFNELMLLKKILQLSINAYNNFDIYESCSFKFMANDLLKELDPLYYEYDKGNDLWMYKRRPDKNLIINLLFNYIIRMKSLEMAESSVVDVNDVEMITIISCPFCNGEFSPESDSCTSCCTSKVEAISYLKKSNREKGDSQTNVNNLEEIKEMVESFEHNKVKNNKYNIKYANENDSQKRKETFECDECQDVEYYSVGEEVSRDNNVVPLAYDECKLRHKATNEIALQKGQTKFVCDECHNEEYFQVGEEVSRDANVVTWTCDECKLRHEATNEIALQKGQTKFVCDECNKVEYFQVGEEVSRATDVVTWTCDKCKLKNGWTDISNENVHDVDSEDWTCGKCGVKNTESEDECVNCHQSIEGMVKEDDKWRCELCKTLHRYDERMCDGCQCSMEICGRWLCKSCTYWNKFIDSRCDVCYVGNDNLVMKYCAMCKDARIGIKEHFCGRCIVDNNSKVDDGWWQCGFENCRVWSKKDVEYCTDCGLWRYNDNYCRRGEALRRFKHGEYSAVWICVYCYRFNDNTINKCGSWICWTKRYDKLKCNVCGKVSDGTTNYCRHCKDLLSERHDVPTISYVEQFPEALWYV